jgi:hypothetical protein
MSTPERQQDGGEHGYGGVRQEKRDADHDEHPLEDPEADPRRPDTEQDAGTHERADRASA